MPEPAINRRVGGLLMAVAAVLSACETRVVSHNSFLTGLQGSEQQLPSNRNLAGYADPTLVREDRLVKEDPATGARTLTARSGRHLMIHIYTCVDQDDAELFVSEVLSERTRREFSERGIDPREGFKWLQEHQEDLQKLFSQMPAGEYTPGLFLRPVGGGVQRVELDGLAAKGLFWTGFDMVQERGSWRLRWMVGPERYDQ
jgi:hypothetical protein